MKRLALVLLLAAAVLPAAAPGAGCSPNDCAPTGMSLGHGLFAVRPLGVTGPAVVRDLRTGALKWRLPSGYVDGHLLVHQDSADLTWFDLLTGKQTAAATVAAHPEPSLVGASQDGVRAVLTYSTQDWTTVTIVTPNGERSLRLAGRNWGFDALAGQKLFLLRYLKHGYEVRLYDLAAGRLLPQPLKDPHESSLIWGTAWGRVASPDGRYLFTLYIGQNGAAMVHQLDLRRGAARCIDLPGTGNFNSASSYTLLLSPNGRTLWAIGPGYGRVVAIDVATRRVRDAFRFKPAWQVEAPSASVAAMSPRGDRIAVALGTDLYVITPSRHAVVHWNRTASALAFSPDGSRLWLAKQQGTVRPLRV